MANRDVDRIAGSSRSTRYRRRKMYKAMFPEWKTCSQAVQEDAHFGMESIATTSNAASIEVINENQTDEVHDLSIHDNRSQFIGLLNVSRTEMINRMEPVIYHSVKTDSLETSDHISTNVQPDVTKIFRKIAISANMSHKQINIMLRHARQIHPELPKDARTLLKTPRLCVKKYIAGGQYVHFGLSETILAALRRCPMEEHEELRLQLHVDGMSVFKSSRLQLWPILGRLINPKTEVFIIGLFCGYSKPKDVHEYFGPLISDLRSMQETGLNVPHMGVSVPLVLDCIIGDAPARAYMKQVKSHAGYYSCERCTSRGKYLKGKMTFSAVPHTLRTDATFRSRRQEEHHIGDSAFENLSMDMICDFPLEYMHLVCLGCTRKLVSLWRSGPTTNGIRLSSSAIKEFNSRIERIQPAIPLDFPRKCRTLDDYERWKATECRQFLLYVGAVAGKGILSEKVYENLVNFSICLNVLCSPRLSQHYVSFVQRLLCKTVSQYAAIYGDSEVTFNFHCLLHLADDVKQRGPLDGFSAFPFESHLRSIRAMVRSPTSPASQIFRRIQERLADNDGTVVPSNRVKNATNVQREQIALGETFISKRAPDNVVLIGNQPAVVEDIDGTNVIVHRFDTVDNFFSHCMPSSDIDIFVCEKLRRHTMAYSRDEVQCKGMLLPLNDQFIFMPVIHTYA